MRIAGQEVPALSSPAALPGAVGTELGWSAQGNLPDLQPWVLLLCWLCALSTSPLSRGLGWCHSDRSVPGVLPGCTLSLCPDPMQLMRVLASLRTLSGVLTFVLFCFLHVQFCKANSRYCISQLICLQRKLTVSLSATISICGFMITTRQHLRP